jgi:hypothetical protein
METKFVMVLHTSGKTQPFFMFAIHYLLFLLFAGTSGVGGHRPERKLVNGVMKSCLQDDADVLWSWDWVAKNCARKKLRNRLSF